MVTFLLKSLSVTLIDLLSWIYFFYWCHTMASLYWEILIKWLSQLLLTFCQTQNGCPVSSHSLWLFLLGWSDWDGLHQAFTNCMHSYNCAHNLHANGLTRTQKSCTVLTPLCKNKLNLPIYLRDHYALRK